MPNGGLHHCGSCLHFENKGSRCALRGALIEEPHWTTCNNVGLEGAPAEGPIYAIVTESRDGRGGYAEIPYFDGLRVDTSQRPGSTNTYIAFTDKHGTHHEFESISDYLGFYEEVYPKE